VSAGAGLAADGVLVTRLLLAVVDLFADTAALLVAGLASANELAGAGLTAGGVDVARIGFAGVDFLADDTITTVARLALADARTGTVLLASGERRARVLAGARILLGAGLAVTLEALVALAAESARASLQALSIRVARVLLAADIDLLTNQTVLLEALVADASEGTRAGLLALAVAVTRILLARVDLDALLDTVTLEALLAFASVLARAGLLADGLLVARALLAVVDLVAVHTVTTVALVAAALVGRGEHAHALGVLGARVLQASVLIELGANFSGVSGGKLRNLSGSLIARTQPVGEPLGVGGLLARPGALLAGVRKTRVGGGHGVPLHVAVLADGTTVDGGRTRGRGAQGRDVVLDFSVHLIAGLEPAALELLSELGSDVGADLRDIGRLTVAGAEPGLNGGTLHGGALPLAVGDTGISTGIQGLHLLPLNVNAIGAHTTVDTDTRATCLGAEGR